MRKLFLTALLFSGLCAGAQKNLSQAYPVLVNLNLSEAIDERLDANEFRKGQPVILSFMVMNPSLGEPVKAGSCALQIQLGKGLKAEAKQAAVKLAFADYFFWSMSANEKGATQLNGKLTKDLPADFTGTVRVELQCANAGTSVVRAQWMDAEQNPIGSLSTIEFTVNKK